MTEPATEILSSSVDVTFRIPVDLSSDLDSPDAPALLAEHTVTLSIESPNPPLTLVNAIAATLDTAIRAVYEGPKESNVTGIPAVVECTDPGGARVLETGSSGVILVPTGTTITPLPKDASL